MTQDPTAAPDAYSDVDRQRDVAALHGMGYAQELQRRMGQASPTSRSASPSSAFSPHGINFPAQGISSVGGAAIGIGWPLGCLVSGVFAVAMAQIASAYPTAGGLYHWGSILGNRAQAG